MACHLRRSGAPPEASMQALSSASSAALRTPSTCSPSPASLDELPLHPPSPISPGATPKADQTMSKTAEEMEQLLAEHRYALRTRVGGTGTCRDLHHPRTR